MVKLFWVYTSTLHPQPAGKGAAPSTSSNCAGTGMLVCKKSQWSKIWVLWFLFKTEEVNSSCASLFFSPAVSKTLCGRKDWWLQSTFFPVKQISEQRPWSLQQSRELSCLSGCRWISCQLISTHLIPVLCSLTSSTSAMQSERTRNKKKMQVLAALVFFC